MLENLPEFIRKSYKMTALIGIFALVLGIVLKKEELYIGFFGGNLICIVNTYLLISAAYKITYIKENARYRGTVEFLKRMAVFCLGMAVVAYVSKKYFKDTLLINIVSTGAGSLTFKFSIFINHFIEKHIKK